MSELQQLRDRVEELEYVIGLRLPNPHDLAMRRLLRGTRQVPRSAEILGMLLKRELVTRDGFSAVLTRRNDDPISDKLLDIYICYIRRVIAEHGIEIETVWGAGYRMTAPNKRKLRALLDQLAEAA